MTNDRIIMILDTLPVVESTEFYGVNTQILPGYGRWQSSEILPISGTI